MAPERDDSEPQPRSTVFVRTLAAGVAVMCATFALLGGLSIRQDYRASVARAENTSQNLSRLLHQFVASDLDEVDLVLLAAVDEIARQTAAGGIRAGEVTAFLAREETRLPQVVSLRATDEHGIVRYGPGVATAARTDLSDREFFVRSQDDPAAGLVVSNPVFARISHQWVVPVARRFTTADGSFGGIVYANIALDHLHHIFSQLEIGRHGSIVLFDAGARVFARHPGGGAAGQDLGASALAGFLRSGAETVTLLAPSGADGVVRTVTARRVAPYGLYVSVGLAERDTLAGWRMRARLIAAVTAGLILVTVALSLALGRAWQHRGGTLRRLARTRIDLERALADLRRSNSDLESFAYAASHDLRQPLRMVTSFLGLIERRYADRLDDQGREFIAYAVDGARHMDAQILSLLDYSRVGREAALEPVELAGAVAEALHNLKPAIAEAEADIRVAPDLPTVAGNPLEMMRLFQNLIGNAVKYRHPDRAPVIAIGLRPDPRWWVVTVTDNGVGIPPEEAERVFGIFQRLGTGPAREGTGIGLAICRKIVERLGGRIRVEPAAPAGSRFVVTLPKGTA